MLSQLAMDRRFRLGVRNDRFQISIMGLQRHRRLKGSSDVNNNEGAEGLRGVGTRA